MLRFCLHYGIHFIAPIAIALVFFKQNRTRVILILLAGIVIDIDHLLANPIFDTNRCSIHFHLLHTYYAISIYFLLLFFKKTQIVGIALLLHIMADVVDCFFIQS